MHHRSKNLGDMQFKCNKGIFKSADLYFEVAFLDLQQVMK